MNNLIKNIQHQYAYGDCSIFAIAMYEIYKLPIVEFYNENDMFHIALMIDGNLIKEDMFVDVFGYSSFLTIKRRYNISGKVLIKLIDEKEFTKIRLFSNLNIEQAKKDLNYLIEMNILPNKIMN